MGESRAKKIDLTSDEKTQFNKEIKRITDILKPSPISRVPKLPSDSYTSVHDPSLQKPLFSGRKHQETTMSPKQSTISLLTTQLSKATEKVEKK